MSERLTKQQLKHDPLMQRTADTAEFVQGHLRTILIAAVVVIAVAATVYFVRAGGARGEERAAGMLAEARADYARGALEPSAARLEDILRSMGGTGAGKQALILYGDVRYAQGQYVDAERYYREAGEKFGDNPLFGTAARRGLAASLENQDRAQDAAAVYQDLADQASTEMLRLDLLLDVARNYVKTGRTDDALAIYTDVAKQSQENPTAAQLASLRLAETQRLAGRE